MKKYLHFQESTVPLYRGQLVVLLSNSIEKIKSVASSFDATEVYAHTLLENWEGGQGVVVVLNFECESRPITYGVIAHEALHAANFILKERGVLPDFDNDEPVTYLIEWITDQIYKKISKHKFEVTNG